MHFNNSYFGITNICVLKTNRINLVTDHLSGEHLYSLALVTPYDAVTNSNNVIDSKICVTE